MMSVSCTSVAVAVHTDTSPSNAEWADFMSILKKLGRPRVLAFTDGGGPNAAQRKVFNDHGEALGIKIPIAVVTESLLVRSIVMPMNMFSNQVQVFTPKHFKDALVHCGLSTLEHKPILVEAARLSAALAGGAPVALRKALEMGVD
jgi:hypothetical protein